MELLQRRESFAVIFEIIWNTFKGWARVQQAKERNGGKNSTDIASRSPRRDPRVCATDPRGFLLRVYVSHLSYEYRLLAGLQIDTALRSRKISVGYFLLSIIAPFNKLIISQALSAIDSSKIDIYFLLHLAYFSTYSVIAISCHSTEFI